jgi:hypothetical protein
LRDDARSPDVFVSSLYSLCLHSFTQPPQKTLSFPPPFPQKQKQDDNGNADSDGGYGSERAGGGFAHKREVVVERPKMPVVQYAVSRYGGEPMGGIQGLWWYAKSLLCDDDGRVGTFHFTLFCALTKHGSIDDSQ